MAAGYESSLSHLTGLVCVRLEGSLFTVGCLHVFSRLQRFVILLGFWVAYLYVDEHDVTLPEKNSSWKSYQLILLCRSFCPLEDALSSLVLWDPFIASIGTTLDIHSQTSILYREILLGEDTKDSSVAGEVSESPISVNQSGIKKMRFSFSALVVQ